MFYRILDNNLYDYAEYEYSDKCLETNIITQQELEASYSKNNNLSSIVVEGYELNEEFNKDTLEYTVSVPSDTEKINLNATVEDKTAGVSGTGEFEVSEGDNKFELIVTAQNGAKKVYTVTIKVEDQNPINV